MGHIVSHLISILAIKIKVKFAITHLLMKRGAIFKTLLMVVSPKMALIAMTFTKGIALQTCNPTAIMTNHFHKTEFIAGQMMV